MAGTAVAFSFREVMQQRAQENALRLDADQTQLVAALDALAAPRLAGGARFAGLYVWGRPGRGKSFIVDNFFASLPLAAKRRAHFHDFFRELHQRMMHQPLEAALRALLGDARLLCFDEFHLHDPGDAMLAKKLLEVALSMNITLILTSNYSPRELLAHPLYHELFVPSIALIEREMTIFALNGERDYRLMAGSDAGLFSQGAWLRPGTPAQRDACGLPGACGEFAVAAGYHTFYAVSPPGEILHFTFAGLCEAPTAVMDYLTLCESYSCWFIDAVPLLANVNPAAQQRFINLIDVLYDKQRQLFVSSAYGVTDIIHGVELDDIGRTASRLSQLPVIQIPVTG
ncbi:cell division protein ZapE [Cronobacter muytjensii]|uniref:cell division protein ZapE n=1 Tax=Cronobacter muytjensii TaxID=413501 RepID=UPI00158814A5|nr:cell division protein ZapE [Cronobacter muytjensii]NUW60784.1 cell division protein ZapE [Cronobacter muytjensii]